MTPSRSFVPTLLAVLALVAPVAGQGPTADPTLKDFEPNGEYDLLVDGRKVPDAEILRAGRVPAYLIVSQAMSGPVLLLPRENAARSVPLDKLLRRSNGMVDLESGAPATTLGALTIDGDTAVFPVDGKKASLVAKPPLVGLHSAVDVERYNLSFGRRATLYTPDAAAVKTLRAAKRRYTVHVVFGSWCPHCQQKVPAMIRLERELAGSSIAVEYFGLPKPPEAWSDSESRRLGITSVPAAVVLADGREVGRILSAAWDRPEDVLAKIVANAEGAAR